MKKRLLEGITILDLTWVMAGPGATKLFCDLGARVIKVESNKTLDVLRTGWQRKGNEDFMKEGGWAYQDFNRGKLDIALNLKTPGGREVLEGLVKLSDVVVANYGPKAFHKLGVTFEELSRIKEDIIVLNASGLGDWGPYSSYITYAPSLMSITGLMGLYGYEGSEAPEMATPLADYFGSLTAANYLLAALEYRRRTGKGQFVDLSQGEGATAFLGSAILDVQANNAPCGRMGNHHYAGSAAPHNVYKCKGDDTAWCAVSVVSEEEWQALRQVVDPAEVWSGAPWFATVEERAQHQKELDDHMEAWMRTRTPQAAAELLQSHGVSAAPVQSNYQMVNEDEHLKERDFFVPVDDLPTDKYPPVWRVCNMVAQISGVEPFASVHRAPSWGEHTDYVLKELLGKTQEWIDNNPIL